MKELFEIILACLAVYGGYCIYINVVYGLFCRNKSKICIAYLSDEKNNNFSEIFFAKRAFLGRTRVIIMVECSQEDIPEEIITEMASGTAVYRAERVCKNDGGA